MVAEIDLDRRAQPALVDGTQLKQSVASRPRFEREIASRDGPAEPRHRSYHLDRNRWLVIINETAWANPALPNDAPDRRRRRVDGILQIIIRPIRSILDRRDPVEVARQLDSSARHEQEHPSRPEYTDEHAQLE